MPKAPVASKRIKITKPYFPALIYCHARFRGKKYATTLLPSKGGMGSKLSQQRPAFITIPVWNIKMKNIYVALLCHTEKGKNSRNTRNIKAKRKAKIRLVTGPARDTSIISFCGFLKYRGSTGTGFAQPKTKAPDRLVITKTSKPIGSMWGTGFRVNLPIRRAVGSPRLAATQPCATSCSIIPKRAGIAATAKRLNKSAISASNIVRTL